MGAVQRTFLFGMIGIIGTIALIDPAPLINSSDIFSQAIDSVLLSHPIPELISLHHRLLGVSV